MFKRALLTAAAVLGLAVQSANAEVSTIYKSGVWQPFAGIANDGNQVCGVMVSGRDRAFTVKWFAKTEFFVIQIFKDGWQVPKSMQVDVSIKFGKASPWTGHASGLGNDGVQLKVSGSAIKGFMDELRYANAAVITFPSGTEAPWSANLTGSNVAVLKMAECMRAVEPPSPPTQPYGAQAAPTQPFGRAAPASQPTQPY